MTLRAKRNVAGGRARSAIDNSLIGLAVVVRDAIPASRVIVVDPALAPCLVARLAVNPASLRDAELAEKVGRAVVSDAHGRVVLLVEVDVATRCVEAHGLPREEVRAHEHLAHAGGPVVARIQTVVCRTLQGQLPCLAHGRRAIAVAFDNLHGTCVGLYAAAARSPVSSGLRVTVLVAVAQVLYDLSRYVGPRKFHGSPFSLVPAALHKRFQSAFVP